MSTHTQQCPLIPICTHHIQCPHVHTKPTYSNVPHNNGPTTVPNTMPTHNVPYTQCPPTQLCLQQQCLLTPNNAHTHNYAPTLPHIHPQCHTNSIMCAHTMIHTHSKHTLSQMYTEDVLPSSLKVTFLKIVLCLVLNID